jgi:predicted GNAT family acetyltransferase
MNAIELKLNKDHRGAFVIEDGVNRLAEMAVAIDKGNLVVFHTQVSDELRGQGVASKLVENMVDYARKNQLKVVALCPYVHAQFKRHAEKYSDVWNQNWRS